MASASWIRARVRSAAPTSSTGALLTGNYCAGNEKTRRIGRDLSLLRNANDAHDSRRSGGGQHFDDQPEYSRHTIERMLQERLPKVSILRQRLRSSPLHVGRPHWEEDNEFNISRHLHYGEVRGVGTDQISLIRSRK